jgi:C4-dicarboxylate transporter DctM subunit
MIWAAMLGTLFTLLTAGVWIGVALGISGIVIMQIWGGGVPLLASALWSSLDIYGLTAIPAFLFMGEIILHGGIAAKMYDSISPLMARLPGKLLQSNIALCAMFAAVFGSSTACAAAIGSIAIPELRKRKYNDRLLLGTICVGGTLALMIPPSGQFVLYGAIAQVSVGALFAAGTVPGIMLAILFMIYLGIQARITPQIAPEEKTLPFKETLRSLTGLWPLFILMVACVGPLYGGLATATESAGIGAAASIMVGSTIGTLRWKDIWEAVKETSRISSMLFFIMLGAMIMATAVSTLGLPRQLIEWVGSLPVSSGVVLICIYILYIILGCFFDGISMMLMTLPFVYPIVLGMGFDEVWFGVLLVLVIEMALVTPPVGMNLFVVQGISGPDTAVSDVFLGSFPFLVCCCIMLTVISFFPGVCSWLPRLLGIY